MDSPNKVIDVKGVLAVSPVPSKKMVQMCQTASPTSVLKRTIVCGKCTYH